MYLIKNLAFFPKKNNLNFFFQKISFYGLGTEKCEIHKKSISQNTHLDFQKKISHLLDNFMTNAMVYSAMRARRFFDLKSGPEILIF